jgi:hypothetical protein
LLKRRENHQPRAEGQFPVSIQYTAVFFSKKFSYQTVDEREEVPGVWWACPPYRMDKEKKVAFLLGGYSQSSVVYTREAINGL